MTQLLLKVLPLDLATTLSPGIFALTLILLGSNLKPKLKTISLLVGTLAVGVGINLLGFKIGEVVSAKPGGSLAAAILDLFFALIFVYLGIKALTTKDRKIKASHEDKHPATKWFLLGIAVNATNFDALFIALNAAKEVSIAPSVASAQKLILIVVNLLFFTLPVTLPLLFYLIFPSLAARILSKINIFVIKYAPYLIFVLMVLIAIFFFYRGVKYFI